MASDLNDDQQNFLRYWFQGFSNGLESLGPEAQDNLLSTCGLACAQSYTAGVFQETWHASNGLQDFLLNLAEHFPEAHYEYRDEQTILVRYNHCACDLVTNGWVRSPVLCQCSRHNLRQNFEQALGKPVQVLLKSSILDGAECCTFEVQLTGLLPG
jgi:predicted ArsR family transcriptional regulator